MAKSIKPGAVVANLLIAALPARDQDRLRAGCTRVDLSLGSVLQVQGDPINHVYFPIDCFISMLTTVDRGSTLEVGMVGNEGMCGYGVFLGSAVAPLRALTQGAGTAWRMEAGAFQLLLEKMPALRQLLGRYVHVVLRQLAQTAACTRFHVVEKRLARWLLMTRDRAHADTFAVTQAFLAFMLGVRRVGVTAAAGALQERKLIRYVRGRVTITNAKRLHASACSCYQSDLDSYRIGMAAPKGR